MNFVPSIDRIPAFSAGGEVNAIVETPQGSQNKFKYDPETGMFLLGSVLPTGHTFPFEFGFIPSTLGEDGDPLDVLILIDAPTFSGCRVHVRVIGVMEATQHGKKGRIERNDRLITVAAVSHRHEGVKSISDLSKTVISEIEHFFSSYTKMKNKNFAVLGCKGPRKARGLIEKGVKLAKKSVS
jgi:inorganic pyrophosphatase